MEDRKTSRAMVYMIKKYNWIIIDIQGKLTFRKMYKGENEMKKYLKRYYLQPFQK